jgi:uncharacterized protein YecT (DUF1311 family)
MKPLTKLPFVFVALFLSTTLYAQSGQEIYAEANKINAEADKQLNAAYDQLIKSIRADNEKDRAEMLVARLRESQRAWLKYRDAQVAFVGIHANIGSASSRTLGMTTYSAELTKERIKDLTAVPNPF